MPSAVNDVSSPLIVVLPVPAELSTFTTTE